MSINWGGISSGECKNDKKVGLWKKMMNSGCCILSKESSSLSKVIFPYLNQDYY